MPGYPPKPYEDNDDDTVDTDADESALPEVKAPASALKKRARLTTVSRAYDLDGDGVLDEAEQAMRDRDAEGRGYLTNEEIYDVVQEQLRAQRSAGYMKRLVAALVCFVVVLALSNLGTSLAAAFLAKDLKAGDDAVMRVAATGDIAAAQSTADVYDAPEMDEEEIEERRRLVLAEMDADPHSHPHRRELARKNKNKDNGRGSNRITLDSRKIKHETFDRMLGQCSKQQNVYMKRKWEEESSNTCICARGTSVVVKERKGKGGSKDKDKNKNDDKKKGKDKGKNKVVKVKGNKDKVKGRNNRPDRDIIFETNGETLHAECRGDQCYIGGGMILQGLNGKCHTDQECADGYLCDFSKVNTLVRSRGRGSKRYGTCQPATVDFPDLIVERAGSGRACNAGWGERACANPVDFYCKPDDFDAQAFRRANGIGGPGAGGRNGAAGYAGMGAVLVGPSGVVDARQQAGGNMGVEGGARNGGGLAQYRGLGKCVPTVGAGQSCFNRMDCGTRSSCSGLGAVRSGGNNGMSGQLVGPSGTITWGMGTTGGMELEGVCSG